MNVTLEHVIAHQKLMRCWGTAKKFCGSGWNDKVAEWQPIIEAVMKKEKCDILPAAIKICQAFADTAPMSVMFVMGVACELIERKQ